MEFTQKDVVVVPSTGEGSSAPVPKSLADYCAALSAAAPRVGLSTGVDAIDCSNLIMTAVEKSLAVDAGAFDVRVEWGVPHSVSHKIDPQDPWVWTSGQNAAGNIFEGELADGTKVYVGVQYVV